MWLQHNTRLARSMVVGPLVLASISVSTASAQARSLPRGVIVEEVGRDSSGEKAGIQPGDVVRSWVRAAAPPANPDEARGDIESSFDLAEIEIEQSPRGDVRLSGTRNGSTFSVVISTGGWAITVRPHMPEAVLSAYEEGKGLIAEKEMDRGVAGWRRLATDANRANDPKLASWLFFKVGHTLADARRWDEAHTGYGAAIETLENSGDSTRAAMIWDVKGTTFEQRNDFPGAEAAYRAALQIRERTSQETLALAASLTRLANIARIRGALGVAGELHKRSLTIRETLAPDSPDVAASLNNLGTVSRIRGDLATAEELFRRSLALRQKLAPDSLDVAATLNNLGFVARNRGDLAAAEALHQQSLAIRERLAPDSLDVAGSLTGLGIVADVRGEVARAEEFYRRSLALRERLAPDSLDVAASLNDLGVLADQRGDLTAAEEFYRRSLAIRERLAPDSIDVAASLNNLAVVAFDRGDLIVAETLHKRALAIRRNFAPNSLDVAGSLSNLGLVAVHRGDLAAAEEAFRRALALREGLAPESLGIATTLNNLGLVASERGDLAAAEEFHKRSLAIREKRAPDSLDVAASLTNLGRVTSERGDLAAAEEYHKRSLVITEKLAPDTLLMATPLNSLGVLAVNRGDLAAAAKFYRRSLAIREQLAPDSLLVAESLNDLGDVAKARGDQVAAEDAYKVALSLRQKLAPGSTSEAKTLFSLGLLARGATRSEPAADYFRRAIAALEAQIGKLGGAEDVRASFTAQYVDYYREYVALLLDLNQAAQAFHVLERYRARSLLAMLTERDLVFAADLPADLAHERRTIDADFDRTQFAIAQLNPAKNAAEIDRLLARLRELRDKRASIAQTIRQSSPRFASLHYPQPLDLANAQQSLDRGTVLLAYCVTKEKTLLLVVQPSDRRLVHAAPAVSVFTLAIGEAALREKVGAFRRLIQRGAGSRRDSTASLVATGQDLFETLIGPAQALISASDRVLISPDGPLHTLPFGAMVQPPDRSAGAGRRYFIEWKPIHIVASATVYAELKKTRRIRAASSSVTLAAFGDPTYPMLTPERTDSIVSPDVRAALRSGFALAPLPASRSEVEGIARLYGDRAATYLGDRATEERAKTIGRDVRYLHFASHGLLDERFPLNSALALTIPGRPAEGQANGLLQAWEIFEQMRIDADLVTLSACETGLGKELGGEGLVGLTRAFQYAGARAVLASLWSVGDESTAELMTRFYGYLNAGKAKDQALRAAQIALIRARGRSMKTARGETLAVAHPFHWAAFQLIGDWK